MEIVIALFLGTWFSLAGFIAYLFVKHDFCSSMNDESGGKE